MTVVNHKDPQITQITQISFSGRIMSGSNRKIFWVRPYLCFSLAPLRLCVRFFCAFSCGYAALCNLPILIRIWD
jgi:hypothetical protein